MHLAFVTSLVTDGKPMTGFEVANEAVVNGLRAIGCKITVVGFRQPRQGNEFAHETIVLDSLDVENANASIGQKVRWLVGAISAGLPVGGSKLRVIQWYQLQDTLNGIDGLDGLIINSIQMPTAFPQLLDHLPFCYVAHNVEHQSARQNADSSEGWLTRLLYARDARLLEPIEQKLCQKAAHIFCLSDDDRQTFGLDSERATLLPLVFPDNQAPDNGKKADSEDVSEVITHDVGLIGTWSWQPNLVGLRWFLDNVVPLLDKGLKISIAGNVPPIAKPDHPGLEFVGRVESAEKFVSQSRVLALISRSGTGVQLKSIEAFQMGMPCVATDSSVRGISGLPDNCFVENRSRKYSKALNNMVKMCKEGVIGRLDGQHFAEGQRQQLQAALRKGLASLE